MPLVPTEDYEDLLQVQSEDTPEPLKDLKVVPEPPAQSPPKPGKSSLKTQVTEADRRKHFQTVMKHTRYTQVDVGTYRYELQTIFGDDVFFFALCAYRPRFERVPKQAAAHCMQVRVAHLNQTGNLELTPWNTREASARRAVFDRPGACLFAYRYSKARDQDSSSEIHPKPGKSVRLRVEDDSCRVDESQSASSQPAQSADTAAATCNTDVRSQPLCETCDCCSVQPPEAENRDREQPLDDSASPLELEAMYEDVDWVALEHLPLSATSRKQIARQVEAVRRVPFQLALASLKEQPEHVEQELVAWLGPQAPRLKQKIGLIEVFAGPATLSHQSEHARSLASIRLGLNFGQDFTKAKDRRLLLLLLGYVRAKDVWFSWPCASWSGWSRSALDKGGSAAKIVLPSEEGTAVPP